MKLRELAHSRAGDKGNVSNLSVFVYDERYYPLLERYLTAEHVKQHFRGVVSGDVVRYALPNLGALNFVLHQSLSGGVTRSLSLDAHGKSLSFALLNMDLPAELVQALGALPVRQADVSFNKTSSRLQTPLEIVK